MKMPYYPNLEGEIARNGIEQTDIASALGITPRALRNKINGVRPFTWPEVDTIHKRFFPYLAKDVLMDRQTTRTA